MITFSFSTDAKPEIRKNAFSTYEAVSFQALLHQTHVYGKKLTVSPRSLSILWPFQQYMYIGHPCLYPVPGSDHMY